MLISTDKALNPHSVYGQSKTLCEWIVGSHGERDDVATRFVAVRFGNVLNSSGSVIPLFRRQIERGGPVTVTDAEMTRFFMTIPEAVALVVQAGAIGGRGRIFVLDMGEPIRILDLARNMIRLSGKEPDVDVPITFIGTRPGEKIHEELFAEGETWKPTVHPKIVALDVSAGRPRLARGEAGRAGRARRGGRDARARRPPRRDRARAAAARRGRRDGRRGNRDARLRTGLGATRPGSAGSRAGRRHAGR